MKKKSKINKNGRYRATIEEPLQTPPQAALQARLSS